MHPLSMQAQNMKSLYEQPPAAPPSYSLHVTAADMATGLNEVGDRLRHMLDRVRGPEPEAVGQGLSSVGAVGVPPLVMSLERQGSAMDRIVAMLTRLEEFV